MREISLRIFNGKQNWRRGEFGKRNYFSFEKQRGKDGKRDVGWLNTCKMFDLEWIDTQKNCNSYISQNINIVYSELNCKILMQKFHQPFFPFKHDRPKYTLTLNLANYLLKESVNKPSIFNAV